MRAVDLGLLGQLPEHDRGRGHRDRPAHHERGVGRRAARDRDRGRGDRRESHLQRTQAEYLAAHREHARQRELEPEREQQEHDADLGEEARGR